MKFKLVIEGDEKSLLVTAENDAEKRILGVLVEQPKEYRGESSEGNAYLTARWDGHYSNRTCSSIQISNMRMKEGE